VSLPKPLSQPLAFRLNAGVGLPAADYAAQVLVHNVFRRKVYESMLHFSFSFRLFAHRALRRLPVAAWRHYHEAQEVSRKGLYGVVAHLYGDRGDGGGGGLSG